MPEILWRQRRVRIERRDDGGICIRSRPNLGIALLCLTMLLLLLLLAVAWLGVGLAGFGGLRADFFIFGAACVGLGLAFARLTHFYAQLALISAIPRRMNLELQADNKWRLSDHCVNTIDVVVFGASQQKYQVVAVSFKDERDARLAHFIGTHRQPGAAEAAASLASALSDMLGAPVRHVLGRTRFASPSLFVVRQVYSEVSKPLEKTHLRLTISDSANRLAAAEKQSWLAVAGLASLAAYMLYYSIGGAFQIQDPKGALVMLGCAAAMSIICVIGIVLAIFRRRVVIDSTIRSATCSWLPGCSRALRFDEIEAVEITTRPLKQGYVRGRIRLHEFGAQNPHVVLGAFHSAMTEKQMAAALLPLAARMAELIDCTLRGVAAFPANSAHLEGTTAVSRAVERRDIPPGP